MQQIFKHIVRASILPSLLLLTTACEQPNGAAPEELDLSVLQKALVPIGTPEGDIVEQNHEGAIEHCIQAELNAITDAAERFEEAFECGDELFEARFNAVDGVGARVGDEQRFTRVPRADKNGPGEWANHAPERATGPNAEACNSCHNEPEDDGAGLASANVIRDPEHTANPGLFIQRNTPHVFAIGALQRLGEEMTTTLQRQRDRARRHACRRHRSVRVNLHAKGVRFGSIRVRCDGDDDTRKLEGVDADLVVKPLQWKGNVLTVRDFNRGAGHNELGMQAIEIVGENVDGDGDGVVNEFGIGDMTALAIYLAAQPRPVSKLELNALGLLELSNDEIRAIRHGERHFKRAGCADCHRPALLIRNPIFSEPSQHPAFRDDPFPAGIDPLAVGVDPNNPVHFDLTADQPDNVVEVNGEEVRLGAFEATRRGSAIVRLYGDLKRHEMGSRLGENIDEAGTGPSTWLTKELWGVGSTAPYMHDGRATTLTEAILEHGGESAASRRRFVSMSASAQADVIAFLNNLILFKLEEE